MSQFTQKILTFALRAGLEAPKKIKLISKGTTFETYQFFNQDQKYVVLRFLNQESNFRPNLLSKSVNSFNELGFPIPKIIATGQIDRKEAVLTEFASGKVKTDWKNKEYEEVGFLLGNLHLSSTHHSVQNQPNTVLEDLTNRLENLDDAIPKEFKTISDELELLEKQWPKDLEKGVIHGDLWFKKVLFEDEKVSALLDFVLPYTDCLIYDLASILKNLFFSTTSEKAEEKFNFFLKGYESARPLTEKEISCLPLMLKAKILYTIVYMLEQASICLAQREKFLSTAMFNLLKLHETNEMSFEKSLI